MPAKKTTKKTESKSTTKPKVSKTPAKPSTKKKSKKETTLKASSVSKKKGTKKTTSKARNTNKTSQKSQSAQSFLAFLGLLLVAGFLVGGLVTSFNFYDSLMGGDSLGSPQSEQLRDLPATGLVEESDIDAPQPTTTEPGIFNDEVRPVDETDTKESRSSNNRASENTKDPRQPEGTTEFNEGDYKVYQYPDGRVIVVW